MFSQRAFPHQKINKSAFLNARDQALQLNQAHKTESQDPWTLEGPFDVEGRITDLELHPV